MRDFNIECVISALDHAWRHAVIADLGQHFTSEIDHLRATAVANLSEARREERFDEQNREVIA